ncbi:hypothetical protein KAW50_05020 [candidate division WOR-3 bacterium]|nr:hypothetical protein [candidate division WOR-3 bacterium]
MKWSDNEEAQEEFHQEWVDNGRPMPKRGRKKTWKNIQKERNVVKKEKKEQKTRKQINKDAYEKRKEEIKTCNFIRKTYRWERREYYAKQFKDCKFINEPFEGCEKHHVNKDTIACIPKELHRSVSHNLKTGKGMKLINDLVFEWLDLQRRKN